jgi:hypothetical protein
MCFIYQQMLWEVTLLLPGRFIKKVPFLQTLVTLRYTHEENAERLVMAIVIADSNASLLRAARFLLDEWDLGPASGEGFLVKTRYYDEEDALRIIYRATTVLKGEVAPRARPGPACLYCPYRDECPFRRERL